jgi:hypothetical protein
MVHQNVLGVRDERPREGHAVGEILERLQRFQNSRKSSAS